MPRTDVTFASLLTATDVDVLSTDVLVEDRGDYVVVRSPLSPTFYWGNFLVWRAPPSQGAREHWEATFAREFADPFVRHRAFAWEGGSADEVAVSEFGSAGYEVDRTVALVAGPGELMAHPRANAEVRIQPLDPRPGADEAVWDAAFELQVENRDRGHDEASYRDYLRGRTEDRRRRFVAGDGAWFVAVTPDGDVAASCGVIVTEGRARYQAVDTVEEHRRQGIARRLVHDAGRYAVGELGARQLVIAADVDYHAFALYESLGFAERERNVTVTWWPTGAHAQLHPDPPA